MLYQRGVSVSHRFNRYLLSSFRRQITAGTRELLKNGGGLILVLATVRLVNLQSALHQHQISPEFHPSEPPWRDMPHCLDTGCCCFLPYRMYSGGWLAFDAVSHEQDQGWEGVKSWIQHRNCIYGPCNTLFPPFSILPFPMLLPCT